VEGWSTASQRLLWAYFRALLERPEVARTQTYTND
jgi:hypothetical protein